MTLSEEGMLLYTRATGRRSTCRPIPVKVRDVSGAGDTVAAVLAVMLALDADFESAMRAANAAASVVVGKSGTATVSAAELRARILPAATLAAEEKIVFDWRELDARLDAMARAGPSHRLHQRRVRSSASRPHQGAGAVARAPATGWWWGSTATHRSSASRARIARSRPSTPAPRCWPGLKRSIWWSSSSRTRRSN